MRVLGAAFPADDTGATFPAGRDVLAAAGAAVWDGASSTTVVEPEVAALVFVAVRGAMVASARAARHTREADAGAADNARVITVDNYCRRRARSVDARAARQRRLTKLV